MKSDELLRIDVLPYPVFFGNDPWSDFAEFIAEFDTPGGIFILTDENTKKYCFPLLVSKMPALSGIPVFSVKPGENSKNLQWLEMIWTWLLEKGARRNSLLICLGGGVVSDLGGFAAATFKRGIWYINVPTSLIGQGDAAIGGKTGINVAGIKNQAGVFYDPKAVYIIPEFLKTLPDNHFRAGLAEIIKCAALSGNRLLNKIKHCKFREDHEISELLFQTIYFKCCIVAEDPLDQSVRKQLNFGHTIGHALESLYNRPGFQGMLHGEAVAAGMLCEAYLSSEINGLDIQHRDEISFVVMDHFHVEPIGEEYFEELLKLIETDKKRTSGSPDFSLLSSVGHPLINCKANRELIFKSFRYHNLICEK